MNDFDFDELDEAVNSLAAKTQQEHGNESPPPPEAVAAVPPAEHRSPVTLAPTASTPVPQRPAEVPVVAPQKHAPRLADTRPQPPRRAFMDIMPPAAQRPVSRTGVALEPVSKPADVVPERPIPVSAPKLAAPAEATPEPVARRSTSPAIETPVSTLSPQSADEVKWPDPLDFHDDAKTPATDAAAEPEPAAPANEPPATPFLPEAKVEKRPLGAYSSFKPEIPPPPQSTTSDELTPEPNGAFKEPPEPHEASPEPEKAEPEKPDLHSTAMMSIPPQYHAPEKPADTARRPVYDIKEYHPPLAEKAMGKHGGGGMWSKLFIALVILVLLAVGGYLTYIYVGQR